MKLLKDRVHIYELSSCSSYVAMTTVEVFGFGVLKYFIIIFTLP